MERGDSAGAAVDWAAAVKPIKRVRRKVMGGLVDMRIYQDGSMLARCDHPSNDPEIEMAMAGRVLAVAREVFAAHGLQPPIMRPVVWKDDPA